MTRAKGPLALSCEDLNLTLPGRGLQAHWRDVYTATSVQKPVLGQTRFFGRTYVQVELNDGLIAQLHVDKNDCAPLAKTMRALTSPIGRTPQRRPTREAWPMSACGLAC